MYVVTCGMEIGWSKTGQAWTLGNEHARESGKLKRFSISVAEEGANEPVLLSKCYKIVHRYFPQVEKPASILLLDKVQRVDDSL